MAEVTLRWAELRRHSAVGGDLVEVECQGVEVVKDDGVELSGVAQNPSKVEKSAADLVGIAVETGDAQERFGTVGRELSRPQIAILCLFDLPGLGQHASEIGPSFPRGGVGH